MGDTVLFEDEVNPVMSVALDQGLSVTALHNHFFFDQPKVYFMHIEGQDSVEKLAIAVRKVYDKIKADPRDRSEPQQYFRPKIVRRNKFHYRRTFERNLWPARRSQRRND